MKLLDENLIILDANVETAEECIRLAGKLFLKAGYVNEEYVDAVVEREKEYPTGLPGDEISIAIPHTNNTYVNNPCVGVVIPNKPVEFGIMGTKDGKIPVEVVFPLVIKDSKMQLVMLREIMKIIQDGELLCKIRDAKDEKEVIGYLERLEACMEK